MDRSSFLVVERGNPYERGDVIPLNNPLMTLGRKGKQWNPDIPFDNVFVSRKHAALIYKNGLFYIKDLNSKHGTFVNQERLAPSEEKVLEHSDLIALAGDLIVLSFSSVSMDETMDITPQMKQMAAYKPSDRVELDPFKQEFVFEEEVYAFSEKEYKCIEILINHKNQFVSKEQMKCWIWPERSYSEGDVPDVSAEELNALIYRVRKKTRHILSIESIRGRGYILHSED
ncbi:FHA domain-containing protein [Paenibacillus sp. GCM10028914]|uniref:FHA domain-containing protein n=1 Tax=Paenibacillus sp. GCM10028914 TaxID=3273416 RepID=UPI00360E67FE